MVNLLAEKLIRSAFAYDEKHNREKLESLFGKFQYFREFKSSTNYMAVSVSYTGVLDITIRGTDGDTALEKMLAWARNAYWKPNAEGMHPGFYESAQWCEDRFEEIAGELPAFVKCFINGHSAGAGIGPQLGIRLSSKISVPIHCISFAAPPTFNCAGKKIFDKHHERYGLSNTYIVNPRDIVTMACRRNKDVWLRGVDAGTRFELPSDTFFQRILKQLWSAREHSPKEYADGLIIASKGNTETIELLKRARKMMVN